MLYPEFAHLPVAGHPDGRAVWVAEVWAASFQQFDRYRNRLLFVLGQVVPPGLECVCVLHVPGQGQYSFY
jgi:hypothetical protein